jgi:hypothetical protein
MSTATGVYAFPGTEIDTVTYWKEGNGLPGDGCIGWNATYTWLSSGDLASEIKTMPPGAVVITEGEYESLFAQWPGA